MAVFRLFNLNPVNTLSCRNLLGSRNTLKCCKEQHASYSVVKEKSLEKLGIPLPPKKPLSPYMRFIKEIRPKVVQNQPDLNTQDVVKVMAEEWRNCDAEVKKSYQKKFLLETQDYLVALEKYKKSITPEQKDLIETTKAKQKKAVEQARVSAKQEELGKPKRPCSPFLSFLTESKAEWKDGKYNIFVKEKSQEWKSMSEDLKEKYVVKAKLEMDNYQAELLKWEEKMIREGHLDVVRSRNILEKKLSKKTSKSVET